MWFYILIKFGKEIPIKKPLIEASINVCFFADVLCVHFPDVVHFLHGATVVHLKKNLKSELE